MSLTNKSNNWNGLPIVIFGNGGAAKEAKFIIDDINASGNAPIFDFLGFVAENGAEGEGVVANDDEFAEFAEKFHVLGVALPFEKPGIKRGLLERLRNIGNIVFPNIIHPKAVIAKSEKTKIGKGVVIGANVIIDPSVTIEDFVFVNAASTIGHDSVIGGFTTIHISANVSGNCVIGKNCVIGTNACIKQGVTIGGGAVCGMGAIVVKNTPAGATVISGKAREIQK